ncbi:cation:proton antiporter [Haloquadratum walsbyi]|uniref:Formate hydrogenlyase subunit 3/multisubunit Na+/H+ antiporter, MnhD subunit n=1 Tax=Haloquadratum walsbyi J07HQW2 TaxID=1238425 RepID=U1N1H9_9EURY|nr:proton-conducting transporter membrane subunit [Haloquadratum walsbyi]ERG96709.1 MAG: formate hydrogenlyase subunit 3/multisubunit Na+/H+ antiporter, MnhD subunit [Haloquadratum walsbyi J07HQW2]
MAEITSLRPLLAVILPAIGIAGIVLSRRYPNIREGATILTAVSTAGVIASLLPAVLSGSAYVTNLGTFVPGVAFSLRADALGTLFALLASFLWIITSFYSIGYMRGLDEHAQTRYFAAFAGSVSAAIGVAFASNLIILYIFYELLTVATYPLVTHDESDVARAAGRKYLAYTFGGGVAVLAGIVLVFWSTGTVAFTPGGIAELASIDPLLARGAFALLAGGFGVKAALIPVHSWLPDAMVAPTPVSGLLHAVAVVKSGVFGISRLVLDVYGPETVAQLGVGVPLAAVAAVTIVIASVIALRQDNLKRRLAYSTISQLSYIVLGLGLFSPAALIGGLLHIPAHAFMKLTLFFCAGTIHVETHTDNISQMAGIGRRMPLTMSAFAVASVGMAGLPLVAGFVSKWYLLIGSVDAGYPIFAVVLLGSGILNIAYFWPIVYQAFFQTAAETDAKPVIEFSLGGRWNSTRTDGRGHEYDDDHDEAPDTDDSDDSTDVVDTIINERSGDADDASAQQKPQQMANNPGDPDAETTYAVDIYPSDHDTSSKTDSGEMKATADASSPAPDNETATPDMNRTQDSRDMEISSSPDPSTESTHTSDAPPADVSESEMEANTNTNTSTGAGTSASNSHTDTQTPTPNNRPDFDLSSDNDTLEAEEHDSHMSDPMWEQRTIWTESTWFMIAPIVVAVTGAIALGIIPQQIAFLSLIEQIVSAVMGVII